MHSCCTDLPYLLSVCTVTHWPPCTCVAQVTKHIVCVSPKNTHSSSHNVEHLATLGDTGTGTPSSLLLNQSFCEHKPCEDRRPQLSGALAKPRPFQVTIPSSLLKTRITSTSPKTGSSLNTRIYVSSNPCPSTIRSQRELTTQRKASRHRSRNRTLTTSNFVLGWLHHCTCRSEKQVQNDRKFITLNEKT